MDIDPVSPIAPARVKALLLPIGRLKKTQFRDAYERLVRERIVRLGDISFENKPGKTTFSPLAYPNGSIFYDITTSFSPSHHASLSPYESFRAPFVIIGIADGNQFRQGAEVNGSAETPVSPEGLLSELYNAASAFEGVISTQLMVFGIDNGSSPNPRIIYVPSRLKSRSTTIKTAMCDVSAFFLSNLADFYRDIQSWPSIETPGSFSLGGRYNGWSTEPLRPDTAISSSRPTSPQTDMSRSRASTRPMTVASLDHALSTMPHSSSRPVTPVDTVSGSQKPLPETKPNRSSTLDQRLGATLAARPASVSRDSSRDRRSLLVNSSANTTERAKVKLKARQGILLGTLYLQSGRWTDALRDLTEAASRAHSISDHVWFSKALENILATVFIMLSAGIDLQLPQILFSTQNKSKSSSILENPRVSEHDGAATLDVLASALPELISNILDGYARGANFPGESLPAFPYAESVIRLCFIISILSRYQGSLPIAAVRAMVTGGQLPTPSASLATSKSVPIQKRKVVAMLFRAYPGQPIVGLSATLDATIIFGGMACVLSHLALFRKRAMLLKDLLTMLVPNMIQARKVGAAEIGMHPAAYLAATQANSSITSKSKKGQQASLEQSLHDIMRIVCLTYGVDFAPSPRDNSTGKDSIDHDQPSNIETIVARFWKRGSGSEEAKLDVLHLCVNLADAIPDFQDVTYFAAALLRTAGPRQVARMPSPGSATLSKEDQLRLRSRIMRTHNMKVPCDVEYWDDFLVRGLELYESGNQQQVMCFNRKDIAGYTGATHDAAATAPGPFLHNPFLKDSAETTAHNVMIAGSPTEFLLTVQNPYAFDITLESITLISEGVALSQKPQGITIGPQRAQRVVIVAIAEAQGTIKITGCRIKVQGCNERPFDVFQTAWLPHPDVKIKARQLPSNVSPNDDLRSQVPETYVADMVAALRPTTLELNIVAQQPLLELVSTSLSQSALTLLEGETRNFTVTVRNASSAITTDFVNLAFEHSPKVLVVQGTRTSADAAAIYEAEYIATHRPPFRWLKDSDTPTKLLPHQSVTFNVAVFGRMGLSEGIVQIDYASLEGSFEKIYTRRLRVPMSVTVSASIFLQRVDMIPLRHSEMMTTRTMLKETRNAASEVETSIAEKSALPQDSFLLVMDFKNSWSKNLAITTTVRRGQDSGEDTLEETFETSTNDTLDTDRITRVVVAFPKLFVADPFRPIPPPASARNSQYLFDASRGSHNELMALKTFWYRQKILESVNVVWKEPGSKRRGIVDLRGITLTPSMTAAIQQDIVEVQLALTDTETETIIERTRDGTYQILADDFFTMDISLTNRSKKSLSPFLLVTPRLSRRPRGVSVDVSRRVSWTGTLQNPLPAIKPGQSIHRAMGWSIMSPGFYEIEVSVLDQGNMTRAFSGKVDPKSLLGRTVCTLASQSHDG